MQRPYLTQSSHVRAARRRLPTVLAALTSLFTLAAPACRADIAMSMPMSSSSDVDAYKHQDLTGLSLDDLMNLDVIPVDVTGTHTHLSKQIMLGVREMTMHMGGNRQGNDDVSVGDVLKRYPVVHTRMTSHMIMLDAMYAPSDSATVMLMAPYKINAMDHINRAGVSYATYSSGFGDLSLLGNYTLTGNIRRGGDRLLLIGGLNFPTGSINKTYDTPSRRNAPLEYMMQLGSGTYDVISGINYLGGSSEWAYGAQVMATNRLGTNSAGYRLGDVYQANSWAYYRINDWVGPSIRLEYTDSGKISGRDARMNPATNPAFDSAQQGGKQLDGILGLDIYVPRGRYKGNRLTLEYGRPLYQNLRGLQLKENWQFTLGYSNTFLP